MKLDVLPLSLPDVKLIRTKRIADVRGYFAESYVHRDFAAAGIADEFVQDNQSFSIAAGTVRGFISRFHHLRKQSSCECCAEKFWMSSSICAEPLRPLGSI